jgi:hypothetical protein
MFINQIVKYPYSEQRANHIYIYTYTCKQTNTLIVLYDIVL